MRRACLAVTISVAMGMTGCGGEAPEPAAEAPVTNAQAGACDLLTAEDAQAVLGEEVNWMSSVLSEAKGGDPAHCAYNAGSDTTRTIALEVRRASSAERARGRFESARSLLSGAEPVSGLGDAAFWLGRGVDQLHVLRGDVHLIVTSHPGPEHDALAAARTVAESALARLAS